VLKAAKECGVYTKSSIMLGLGETGEASWADEKLRKILLVLV
jgi:lipoate synthase